MLQLPEAERNSLTQQLPDLAKAQLEYQWQNWIARPNQEEPPGSWLYWLIMSGRGFGKTRMGAEWVRRQAQRFGRLGLIGKDAADMRDVMVEGESGIMAACPPWERPTYRPSKRELVWPNGAIAHCRTGEDPEGVRGIQFARLWCDEIAAWQYPQETWDMALLATRLGADARVCVTTTPKPIRVIRDLASDPDCVVTRGSTYDNLANLSPTFRTIIRRYEGTRLGRQELHGDLLEDEGLAYRFSERIHVVPPFEVPAVWDRFEHMDYGYAESSATAWYCTAVDFEGNLIVFDGVYRPGLPSELAPFIRQKRLEAWEAVRDDKRQTNVCYADPSTFAPGPLTKWGRPPAPADEYRDLGITITKALTNDRRAGFVRISELLRLDPERCYPSFHELHGQPDAPRLYVMDVPGTVELREQLVDAPLEDTGRLTGEAVQEQWEHKRGHGHASLRYGLISRPGPSEEPYEPLQDERAEWLRQYAEQQTKPRRGPRDYIL